MIEIPARYLMRLALHYLRQSTEEQVRKNEGSRLHQEAQRDHALRCGWSPDNIITILDDLGISGLDASRPGYRKILTLIETGTVGAVFISEVGRGGRDDRVWMDFLKLLALHDVLLFENGVPTDPHDDDQVFVKKIQAITVHRENQMRTTNLHRGRLAKARAGKAVSAPPIGYVPVIETRDGVVVKTGAWVKDPDPAVRESLEAVFKAFREGRSLARAVRLLKAWQVKIPSRRTTPQRRRARP
jgi:DNA invertase Pin-like site-specific DNA recombinase